MSDRLEELLQRELDGENAPDESKELRQRLADDADARARHERLLGVARALDEVGQVEPPAGLLASVMRAVRGLAQPQPRREGFLQALAGAFARRAVRLRQRDGCRSRDRRAAGRRPGRSCDGRRRLGGLRGRLALEPARCRGAGGYAGVQRRRPARRGLDPAGAGCAAGRAASRGRGQRRRDAGVRRESPLRDRHRAERRRVGLVDALAWAALADGQRPWHLRLLLSARKPEPPPLRLRVRGEGASVEKTLATAAARR